MNPEKEKEMGTPDGVNAAGPLRESLAELMHVQWSEIMRSLFRRLEEGPGGTRILPIKEYYRRLELADKAYADLSEKDKDKDREQADRALRLLAQPLEAPSLSPSPEKIFRDGYACGFADGESGDADRAEGRKEAWEAYQEEFPSLALPRGKDGA